MRSRGFGPKIASEMRVMSWILGQRRLLLRLTQNQAFFMESNH